MRQKAWMFLVIGSIVLAAVLAGIGITIGYKAGTVRQTEIGQEKIEDYVLEKTKLDPFSMADIAIRYADFTLLPSDGYYLEYALSGQMTEPKYSVSDGKLIFQEGRNRVTGIFSFQSRIRCFVNLYVPEDQYFELLKVYNGSGDVALNQIKAKEADLDVEYGDLTMESFEGTGLTLVCESGDLKSGGIKAEDVSIKNEYGMVELDALECTEASLTLESGDFEVDNMVLETLALKNEYGDVSISNLNCNKGSLSLDSGSLRIKNNSSQELVVKCEYGDAKLAMANLKDYKMDLKTEYGSVYVNGKEYETEDSEGAYESEGTGGKSLEVYCESGDVHCDEL